MRILSLCLVVLCAAACYKPEYAANPDAGIGFRCHKSDDPTCPTGLVCCLDGVCGNDLKDDDSGWCVPPPAPVDMSTTGLKFWPFPSKAMYFDGTYMPVALSGYDDQMQWRCTRDDTNPMPPAAIARMGEPNDLPSQAVFLSNPTDYPHASVPNYQICPDRTAPDLPDVDSFHFKLATAAHVLVEIKYQVAQGDLDLAIFRLDTNPDTGVKTPTLIGKDVTAVSNACIEMNSLAPGEYYAVVRGVPVSIDQPGKYTMNNYTLGVYTISSMMPHSCTAKDGGP